MVKPMPPDDFRAVRRIMEPDDFAVGPDGPDPAPTDLVDRATWDGLMICADDVSIRTSDHYGRYLRALYELQSAWSAATGDVQDNIWETMVDAIYELHGATFDTLHGYYRQAIASLRSAFELVAIGTYCQVRNKQSAFRQWRSGLVEMSFGAACDGLIGAAAVKPLERHLRSAVHDTLFAQKQSSNPSGWLRQLYSALSNYAHSRPGYTTVDLWGGSNGPVFIPKTLGLTLSLHFQVYAACYLLVKIGRPTFLLPAGALQLFAPKALGIPDVARTAYAQLFGIKVAPQVVSL